MEDQSEFIMRRPGGEEVGSEANARAALEDIGNDADLYISPINRATRKTITRCARPARSFGYCLIANWGVFVGCLIKVVVVVVGSRVEIHLLL